MGCGASTLQASSAVVPPAQQEFNAIEDVPSTAPAAATAGSRPEVATSSRPPIPPSTIPPRPVPTSARQQAGSVNPLAPSSGAAAVGSGWEQARQEEQSSSSRTDATVHGCMAAMQHLHVRLSAVPSGPSLASTSTPGPIPSDSPAIHAAHAHPRPHALRDLGAPRATSPSPYGAPRPASATEEDELAGPPRPSPLHPGQQRAEALHASSLQPTLSGAGDALPSPLQPARSEAEDVLMSQSSPHFMMHPVPAKMEANRYEASSLTDDEEEEGSGQRPGFDLKQWHTFYRQNRTKHTELLDFLWRRFDPAHHSIFAASYKAQDQLLAGFQGDNVMHGFCCRVEGAAGGGGGELFGLMHTLSKGAPNGFKVLGAFITAGQDLPAELGSLAEAEHFQLLKADTADPLVRQFVGQLLVGSSPVPDMRVISSRQVQPSSAGS